MVFVVAIYRVRKKCFGSVFLFSFFSICSCAPAVLIYSLVVLFAHRIYQFVILLNIEAVEHAI